jgi:hypothetical protein
MRTLLNDDGQQVIYRARDMKLTVHGDDNRWLKELWLLGVLSSSVARQLDPIDAVA